MKHPRFLLACICSAAMLYCGCQSQPQREGPIIFFTPEVDASTGKVTVNGVDPRRPTIPFTWNWGDGQTEAAWFPLTHVYSDTKRDYTLTVTAHYGGGKTSQAPVLISFRK